jgi:hypothetical protein
LTRRDSVEASVIGCNKVRVGDEGNVGAVEDLWEECKRRASSQLSARTRSELKKSAYGCVLGASLASYGESNGVSGSKAEISHVGSAVALRTWVCSAKKW